MASTLRNPQPVLFHPPTPVPPSRLSPVRNLGRKRKVDHEEDSTMARDRSRSPDDRDDEHMNRSPSNSPGLESKQLNRPIKRARNTVMGRPLPLYRVLETIDANGLKNILREICARHPGLEPEILSIAPRPTVQSALSTLRNYETALHTAFPYGVNPESDYTYYRVKAALVELLDALSDYTPHFLPPNETQANTSLQFLDGATDIIHRLPNWSTPMHNHHKQMAYEEISKAWALVVREAAKRGAGVGLQYGGWDSKIARHNEQAGGRMDAAVHEMRRSLLPRVLDGGAGGNGGNGSWRPVVQVFSPTVPVRSL